MMPEEVLAGTWGTCVHEPSVAGPRCLAWCYGMAAALFPMSHFGKENWSTAPSYLRKVSGSTLLAALWPLKGNEVG